MILKEGNCFWSCDALSAWSFQLWAGKGELEEKAKGLTSMVWPPFFSSGNNEHDAVSQFTSNKKINLSVFF